ncbi:hypothetical protein F5Y16DRAFT_395705 [Xylariaceae sp. FL0255]|nr:hypothetical protein F5Y16DRAFT_395705 [Xylariaceae sp. FL0255]
MTTMQQSIPSLPSPIVMARTAGGLLGALGLVTGTMALTRPTSFMPQFFAVQTPSSLPSASSMQKDNRNPLIRVLGGRTLASGFGLIALAALKLDRAIGVMLCCSIIAGGVDGWAVYRHRADYVAQLKGEDASGHLASGGASASTKDEKEDKEAFKAAFGHWALLGVFSAMGAWMIGAAEQ